MRRQSLFTTQVSLGITNPNCWNYENSNKIRSLQRKQNSNVCVFEKKKRNGKFGRRLLGVARKIRAKTCEARVFSVSMG